MNNIASSHKAIAGSTFVAITSALLLMAATAPLVSGGVTSEPDKVKGSTRVLVTFSVTNTSDENVDNILIRPADGTFTEAIGGQLAADNLTLAADNMENAVSPLQLAGENLILAEDNIVSSSTDFGDMNTYLQEPLQDDWLLAAGDFPQAGDNAWDYVETAGGELGKVSSAIDNEVLNLTYLSSHLEHVADNLDNAAGNPFG